MNLTKIDTLIDARWIIPVEPGKQVLENHSLVITDGKIAAILPTEEAAELFTPQHHYRLNEHVLIPGLINLHSHAPMTLLRGVADDLPLMEWLNQHIWPAEAKHVTDEFVYDGTLLACAEMLRGGVTCFNDMYFFPEAVARAALTAKMRAAIGLLVIEFPSNYAINVDDYLNKGLAMRDEFRSESLLSFCMAPHAPYTISDGTFEKVLMLSDQLNLPIHTHIHETIDEISQSLSQYGVRPLERLHRLDLLSPSFIGAHAVHLTSAEIELLAYLNCSVIHCPSSNMKLASGIAPMAALQQQGVNIGLGTDGAASNNRLDLFTEMRAAALLAKVATGEANVLPAHEVLQMATLNGAKALGLDDQIGSLTVGKFADITAIDLSSLESMPCYEPLSHLVYAAERNQVSHVWVNGELLMEDRQLTTMDLTVLQQRINRWQERIKS